MESCISVVIPTLNEVDRIERTIRRAWEAGFDEILVVDGGSEDGTAEIAAKGGAKVLLSERGRAAQQNAGAAQAEGDTLVFLHADNWLASGAAQQIHVCMTDEQVLGGAFVQQIEASGRLYRMLEKGNAARARWRGLPYGDQAIFIRKPFFQQLSGFPPVLLMEDLLLMREFRRRSWPVLLPGPVHVDPRRWQRHGVVRQTLRNWLLLSARAAGVSPDRLARFYPTHDGH